MPLSLQARARMVVCAGFDGATIAAAPLDELRALAPGGFILFARNVGTPQELRALVGALREIGDLSALIAIDQEGGRVARIRAEVAEIPAMMALGATGDAELAQRVGALVGADLRRFGITVDFAPCGDLAREAQNTVIGARSFGSDPQAVARIACAFARGLEAQGVAATIKHFPGHGATVVDSHRDLPRITLDARTLRASDFVPFAEAIRTQAVSAVMSAHIVVDAFDSERPATLSPALLTGVLREELGFTGVTFTDCMEMDAIANGVGTVAGAVAALRAGADCVVISHHLDLARAAVAAIVAAVEHGELPESRLDEAVARVGALRERFQRAVPAAAVDRDAGITVARDAVTVIRGSIVLPAGQPVTVISFEGATYEGAAGRHHEHASLNAALRARRFASEIMRVPLAPDADDIDLLGSLIDSQRALAPRTFVVMMRRAHLFADQQAAIARILARAPEAILISAREPYDLALFPAARAIAAIYGDEAVSIAGLADVMAGRAIGRGRLPVALEEMPSVR